MRKQLAYPTKHPNSNHPISKRGNKMLGRFTQLEGHGRVVQRSTVLDIFLNGLKNNTLVEATPTVLRS